MAARNLEQWLSYLEQLHPSEIDMGLARVQDVAQRLGLPRIANKIVTVTGTNGKGSTCAFGQSGRCARTVCWRVQLTALIAL